MLLDRPCQVHGPGVVPCQAPLHVLLLAAPEKFGITRRSRGTNSGAGHTSEEGRTSSDWAAISWPTCLPGGTALMRTLSSDPANCLATTRHEDPQEPPHAGRHVWMKADGDKEVDKTGRWLTDAVNL